MGTWNTRGLRGSTFEDAINRSNDTYKELGLCLIQKVPTPITPINIDHSTRHITLAYFDQKSTVDYIGVVQGVAVCFDAKECATDTFPLANIHPHQVAFMRDFEKQDGVAFILIYYSEKDMIYYMKFCELANFWERMEKGGRKSFRFDELDEENFILPKNGILVPYLDGIARDLDSRN